MKIKGSGHESRKGILCVVLSILTACHSEFLLFFSFHSLKKSPGNVKGMNCSHLSNFACKDEELQVFLAVCGL